ncbi:MMPL family transporter [Mycobacterium sp. CVI_P3]|uniref:MMPL family transporter n=1 Tax=Mycobacterium pinniadriaticum TaxID=2994102 RepID=A0ABT3SGP6_9MYCO|nr:MMPL family transporter [Mycobacterium pinniadriaticum]MCX2931851.1 MMPL family transporter [Mycobacterium pinniadriaticum]MCX2938338.1 MMPL family transporter [Mycobacterium pinniadriaticum]
MMRLSSNLRRFRWLVFSCWLLALVPAVYLALTQSNHLTGGGFDVAGSQSLHVQYHLEDHFPEQGASPLALVAAPRADASYDDMNAAVAKLEEIAKQTPSVVVMPNPAQPAPAPDKPYVVSLRLDFNNTGAVDIARQLRQKVGVEGDQPGQTQDGRVRLYVIGQGALGAAAQTTTKHDIAEAERWNLPIVLIVLLAVFGSLAAAAVPLLLGLCTVVVTMGVVYLLSTVTTMSVFVTSTVSMFGIALAVDYSLFILMRFREELRAGRDPQQAADAAMATSGLAVLLSGLTVIASLTGIYLINTPVLRSMATGAILAVAIAVLTSTTLTPAVLATFGRSVAKRSPLLQWSRRGEATQSRFWTRWVGEVMRRPWLSALAATLVLLLMAAPAFSMVLGNSMQRQFKSAHEIRGGVAAAAEALGPGALGPVRVLVTFPDGGASDPKNAPALEAISSELAKAPDIVSVSTPVFADNNDSALFSAVLSVDPEDLAARNSIDWMRSHLRALPAASGVQIDVGGPTALIKDFDDRVSQTQPWVFLFVALIAFVMLLISVRSVFLAFKGVLMTVLSVAAAYGSLVMVFQWGWLEGLGFERITSIDSTIPPLVLAMTFGLSMDYEIFLLTRIRERYLQAGDTRDAVAYGVSTSARTITSAALIMIAVFTGFAFAGMPLVAELGVACAVAIAVDATVVRLVLVPALMAMFDQWNWWLPSWLARILPSVDFEKPLPKVDLGDLVVIPDDISALVPPAADLRMVVKGAARLKNLAPDAVSVADPLAFSGCHELAGKVKGSDDATADRPVKVGVSTTATVKLIRGYRSARLATARPVHPVTMWRGRLAIALDALETGADTRYGGVERLSPVETTNVQLPTGDRLQIPTCAETLRMQAYLIICRNSRGDFAEFADLIGVMDTGAAAVVLAGMDRYYCSGQSTRQWVTTQLVRRLADPNPSDVDDDDRWAGPEGAAEWERIRQRCLSVAVAILEEAR